MNDDDLALRNLTYARFVELGRAPGADEIAAGTGRSRAEVMAGWERLDHPVPRLEPGQLEQLWRTDRPCALVVPAARSNTVRK